MFLRERLKEYHKESDPVGVKMLLKTKQSVPDL